MSEAVAEQEKEKGNRVIAILGTVLVHGAIILFLIWYVIITPIPPYPPPKTPGVEVALDFGNNINGTGNVEAPNKGNNPATDNKAAQSASKAATASNPVVTNDAENDAHMNSSKTKSVVKKPDTVQPKPQISIDLAAAENKFKHAKGAPGGNGNSGEAGNAGNPNGTTPGVGNGNGGPFHFFLQGRDLVRRPSIQNASQDQGKVVVSIIVDQGGKVIKATPGEKGSTTTSPYLYEKAKEAALATKFSTSPNGTPEQQGTITIVFVIQ